MTAAVAAMPVPVRYWQQRLRCSIHVASSFCHVLFCAGAPPPQHPMRPTDNPWASVVFLICATCLGLSFSLLLRPDSTLLFSLLFFAEITVIVCSHYSGLALHSLKSWAPLRVTFGAVAL